MHVAYYGVPDLCLREGSLTREHFLWSGCLRCTHHHGAVFVPHSRALSGNFCAQANLVSAEKVYFHAWSTQQHVLLRFVLSRCLSSVRSPSCVFVRSTCHSETMCHGSDNKSLCCITLVESRQPGHWHIPGLPDGNRQSEPQLWKMCPQLRYSLCFVGPVGDFLTAQLRSYMLGCVSDTSCFEPKYIKLWP